LRLTKTVNVVISIKEQNLVGYLFITKETSA